MARLFDNASSEYLSYAGAVITGMPITIACWFNTDTNTNQVLFNLYLSSVDEFDFRLQSGQIIRTRLRVTTNADADSTTTFSLDTWHHACGVFASTTSRSAYLDGGNKGTNTTSKTPGTPVNTAIGSRQSLAGQYMSGSIAEMGVWNIALSDAEVAILAAGYAPPFVRPQNLVAYWPLIRDEDQDRVGGYDMTPQNTPSISTHPPIIYPATPFLVLPESAAPVGITGPLVGGKLVKSGPLIKGRLV